MKNMGKYLKILAIILAAACIACSPVRTKKSTSAKESAKTVKTGKVKESSHTNAVTKKSAGDKEKVKTRFSDTTVIYLSNPPE